jgi:hypothetical protein
MGLGQARRDIRYPRARDLAPAASRPKAAQQPFDACHLTCAPWGAACLRRCQTRSQSSTSLAHDGTSNVWGVIASNAARERRIAGILLLA